MSRRVELTPSQRRRCNRLIKKLCANYDGGNCLPLDEGDGCACVQMISLSLICKYFRNAVLPADHLRKLKDGDDPFNEVSGSTGITGAADTNYVLKRKRSSRDAMLLACGRDVEYQELTLRFQDLKWELIERKNTEEIRKAEIPQFLFRVVEFMKTHTEWVGTATELIADMAETETTPNVVNK